MALNRWGFPKDVGLITRTDQLIQSLTRVNVDTSSISTVINNAASGLDDKIEEAKNEVIEAMPDCCGGGSMPDCCCTATKCDIRQAVNEIKEHIDNTVNGEKFTKLFSNVNDIYEQIINE